MKPLPSLIHLLRHTASDYQRYLGGCGYNYRALLRNRLAGALRQCRVVGGERLGWALWQSLAWDNARLNCRVARIAQLLAPAGRTRRTAGEELLRRVARAARPSTDLLTMRLDGDDVPLLQAAEQQGFVTVDLMHSFHIARGGMKIGRVTGVRPGTDRDLPAVQRIARTAFACSRLYHDPLIAARRADRFYTDLTTAIAAQSAVFIVAEERGRVAGFCLGTIDGDLPAAGPRLGYLWLIAVAEAQRGRGTGARLLRAFLREMFTRVAAVEISTQCANVAATRLYAGFGLTPCARLITLHKWLDR